MRQWPNFRMLLVVLGLSTQSVQASDNLSNCRLQNDVGNIIMNSQEFLKYLETGSGANTVLRLERSLKDPAVSGLLQRLIDNGHKNLAAQLQSFVKQQRQLVFSHEKSGRRTTAATALDMRVKGQLSSLSRRNTALPCRAPAGAGGHNSVSGRSVAQSLLESGVLYFFGITLVVGGLAAGGMAWWSQVSMRRAKRYSCMIPCSVVGAEGRQAAVIVDLSRAGAIVDLKKSIAQGEEVELNFLGETATGRVVRNKNGSITLNFLTMLNTAVIDKALFDEPETGLVLAGK